MKIFGKTTSRIVIISEGLIILLLIVYTRIQTGYAVENLAVAMAAQEEAMRQREIAMKNTAEAQKQAKRASLLAEELKQCQ